MELCRILSRTPAEIGELRRKRPEDIAFLEQHILFEAKQREKAQKEMERKAKAKKGKHR